MKGLGVLVALSTSTACVPPPPAPRGPLAGQRCTVEVRGELDPLLESTVRATFTQTARELGCDVSGKAPAQRAVVARVTVEDQGPLGDRGLKAWHVTLKAEAPWLGAPLQDALTVPCLVRSLAHPPCHGVLMFRLEPLSHAAWDAAVVAHATPPAGAF